ncbi:MAG: hypothetical protein AAGF87_00125 [Bacteroidota bacterium]
MFRTTIPQKADHFISRLMGRISRPAIRISFGIIFIWFGILKPLGYSSAEDLLLTLEGQYIIKNLMIISAAMVLGG